MGEVNILVGLSGVGKGTVMEEAMLLADQDYKKINYGDKMLETAKNEGLVETRDELKDMDPDTNKRIQKKAAEQILEESKKEDVIVETHAAIQTPFGYIPGLPKWTVENLEPEKIIMLKASPEAIWERTQEDDTREREHEEVSQIREYQDIAREMASTGAVMTGAYLKTIENKDGKAEAAAEELVKTLRA